MMLPLHYGRALISLYQKKQKKQLVQQNILPSGLADINKTTCYLDPANSEVKLFRDKSSRVTDQNVS